MGRVKGINLLGREQFVDGVGGEDLRRYVRDDGVDRGLDGRFHLLEDDLPVFGDERVHGVAWNGKRRSS